MASIKDVLVYFCRFYPHQSELSKARLTKMVYLADWKSALDRGKQITKIEWIFNHYGPYVEDVTNIALKDPLFEMENSINLYGSYKETIKLKSAKYSPQISDEEKEILDHIIKITAPRYWNAFMELVYSTYPILKSDRYEKLDLINLAKSYKAEKILE